MSNESNIFLLDEDYVSPSAALLFKRGWFDVGLILLVSIVATLLYFAAAIERESWLEERIGYSATRLLVIISLALFLWGTLQGCRGKIVVFINDELTPLYSDAAWTFGIVLGMPVVGWMIWLALSLGSWLLFPAQVTPPRYDDFCIYFTLALWCIGAIWIFARLYAYNRNALTTFAAFVTKLSWCCFALLMLNQADNDLRNETQESTYNVATNFITHMVLFFLALFIIGQLTYHGPSLRNTDE